MKTVLLKMKVCGIKNIDKEVTIEFSKSSLKKFTDFSNSHVKAIYGANGSGKTAIVYAAEIYKNIVLDDSYINLNNANSFFENIINKKLKKCTIEMTFALLSGENEIINILTHKIVIDNKSNKYLLSEEKLTLIKGFNINKQEKHELLYHIVDGEIQQLSNKADTEFIKETTKNLLTKQALPDIVFQRIKEEKSQNLFYFYLNITIFFALNLTVVLQSEDVDYIDFWQIKKQFELIKRQKENQPTEIFSELLERNRIPKNNSKYVFKKDLGSFEKFTKKLNKFLKVFKEDLKDIEIKREENDDYYECETILIYKNDIKVNLKYESTGIKKLIQLFTALCDIENEQIVFIDEFDANIHDVLITKLLEYIVQYTKGQFIFTTHNLSPMNVLKNQKNSIDFLSNDSKLISWKKNGNYSPETQYRKGMIEHSPFNFEAFNFIGSFRNDR